MVGQVEAALGLHDVAEQVDHVPVFAVELQLHVGFVVFKVLSAHDSIIPHLAGRCELPTTAGQRLLEVSRQDSCGEVVGPCPADGGAVPGGGVALVDVPAELREFARVSATIMASRSTFARTLAAATRQARHVRLDAGHVTVPGGPGRRPGGGPPPGRQTVNSGCSGHGEPVVVAVQDDVARAAVRQPPRPGRACRPSRRAAIRPSASISAARRVSDGVRLRPFLDRRHQGLAHGSAQQLAVPDPGQSVRPVAASITTMPTLTGPARAPRPTSSQPATSV